MQEHLGNHLQFVTCFVSRFHLAVIHLSVKTVRRCNFVHSTFYCFLGRDRFRGRMGQRVTRKSMAVSDSLILLDFSM